METRSITFEKAVKYTELATKLVACHLASPEERSQYFKAIKALRKIADDYCEIHGLAII